MPRAEISLPTGAKVVIEGSEEEVRFLLDVYGGRGGKREPSMVSPRGAGTNRATSRKPVQGPIAYVRQLKEEGFFNAKRPLKAIQEKLAEKGHIYSQPNLSPALIRLVRNRELGRLKEKGAWVYVTR